DRVLVGPLARLLARGAGLTGRLLVSWSVRSLGLVRIFGRPRSLGRCRRGRLVRVPRVVHRLGGLAGEGRAHGVDGGGGGLRAVGASERAAGVEAEEAAVLVDEPAVLAAPQPLPEPDERRREPRVRVGGDEDRLARPPRGAARHDQAPALGLATEELE